MFVVLNKKSISILQTIVYVQIDGKLRLFGVRYKRKSPSRKSDVGMVESINELHIAHNMHFEVCYMKLMQAVFLHTSRSDWPMVFL